MKSIIDQTKRCYVCGRTDTLHLHHILFGKNRNNADKDGLTVYLCWEHHEGTNGVHGKNGSELNKELKTPTSFRSIQELKYYIRDRNPLINMATL